MDGTPVWVGRKKDKKLPVLERVKWSTGNLSEQLFNQKINILQNFECWDCKPGRELPV